MNTAEINANWPITVWIGLIGTPLMIAGGQVLFKLVSARLPSGGVRNLGLVLLDPYFIGAMVIYLAATVSWIYVLRSVPLGIAYSFTALGFEFVPSYPLICSASADRTVLDWNFHDRRRLVGDPRFRQAVAVARAELWFWPAVLVILVVSIFAPSAMACFRCELAYHRLENMLEGKRLYLDLLETNPPGGGCRFTYRRWSSPVLPGSCQS